MAMAECEITLKITKPGRAHKIKIGAVVRTMCKMPRKDDELQCYAVAAALEQCNPCKLFEGEREDGWAKMWVYGDECKVVDA